MIPLETFNAQQKGIYQAAKETGFKMVGNGFFGVRFQKVQVISRPYNAGDRKFSDNEEIK
jgi:hypothetical protein